MTSRAPDPSPTVRERLTAYWDAAVMACVRIVEAGTHNELMALKGLYADLCGLQARQYA